MKKNGKWLKSKNPENVVVAFAGTDITKDPIFDCGNIVFGNDPKTEVYLQGEKQEWLLFKERDLSVRVFGASQ
ncbi:hypothetical protein BAGR45_17070 [Bacillus velezensis]|nr:hypothetical protein BAGR45_17070 [Bacillus velezensis]